MTFCHPFPRVAIKNSFTWQEKKHNTKTKYEKQKKKILPMVVLINVELSENIHKGTKTSHKNKKT
jgi:hypothetical protein